MQRNQHFAEELFVLVLQRQSEAVDYAATRDTVELQSRTSCREARFTAHASRAVLLARLSKQPETWKRRRKRNFDNHIIPKVTLAFANQGCGLFPQTPFRSRTHAMHDARSLKPACLLELSGRLFHAGCVMRCDAAASRTQRLSHGLREGGGM